MHVPGERLHVLDRRRGQNAVAEIEDVPRSSPGTFEDIIGRSENAIERAKQQRRIEVALDAAPRSDSLPCVVGVGDSADPDQRDLATARFAKLAQRVERERLQRRARQAALLMRMPRPQWRTLDGGVRDD